MTYLSQVLSFNTKFNKHWKQLVLSLFKTQHQSNLLSIIINVQNPTNTTTELRLDLNPLLGFIQSALLDLKNLVLVL